MTRMFTVDYPGDWNPHVGTDHGQFTYRVREIDLEATSPENVAAREVIVMDTTENLAEVRDALADLLSPDDAGAFCAMAQEVTQ